MEESTISLCDNSLTLNCAKASFRETTNIPGHQCGACFFCAATHVSKPTYLPTYIAYLWRDGNSHSHNACMNVLLNNVLPFEYSNCISASSAFVGSEGGLPLLLNDRHFRGTAVAVDVHKTTRQNHRQHNELHLAVCSANENRRQKLLGMSRKIC